MEKLDSLESILGRDASLGAEQSYYFLMLYQMHLDWNVYDSNELGFGMVEQLASMYCNLHGRINVSSREKSMLSIWSADPLGVFRYRMDNKNFWQEIGYLNKIKGYVVEGAYWNNGFCYRVLDKSVVQLKLYIDDVTMRGYFYPPLP